MGDQSEVTFNASRVNAANLEGAIVSRDIVNNNEITARLSNSANLSALALTDLYNANGTQVALSLSVVDPNNNNAQIAAPQPITDIADEITFDLGTNNNAKWNDVALLLTATSTYNAQGPTSITAVSSTINLIHTLLTFSVSATQPDKNATELTGTLTIDEATNYTTAFEQATVSVWLAKNDTAHVVDLSTLTGDVMNIATIDIEKNALTHTAGADSTAAISFSVTGNTSLDGHGLYFVVTGTQTRDKVGMHNFTSANSSANKIYKFDTPTLSYAAGDETASIVSNGYKLNAAVTIDMNAGQQELTIVYIDNAQVQPAAVNNNLGFNYWFSDAENSNAKQAIQIEMTGLDNTAETLLSFLGQVQVGNNGVHLINGQKNLENAV